MIRVARDDVARHAVGASEVGAVLGCDPWTTPLSLYRRKRGLDDPKADNAAMQVGRELEGSVVRLAARAIPVRVRRNRLTFAHPTVPLFATPDAFVGRDRVLEAKVVGLRSPAAFDDVVPCHVRVQVQAQLLVTGREAGYVATLAGTELRLTLVDRDPVVQAAIEDAVTTFVNDHLDAEYAPDPLTFDERWFDLLAAMREAPEGDVVVAELLAGAELQAAGDRLLEVRQELRRLEDEADALRLALGWAMTAAGGSRLTANGWSATAQERRGSTSWKDVAAALASEYMVDPDWYAALVDRHRGEGSTTFVVREHRSRNE